MERLTFMLTPRIGIAFAVMFVAFSGSRSTSAAELEIKKDAIPATPAISESSASNTPAKRELKNHQLVRLAARQYDVRMPACCGTMGLGLILGVGY
jgi:hypothetical protein